MKTYFIAVGFFLGVGIQISGIVGNAVPPRPPTHIVSSEHHQTRHGCQLETINHLNNSKSYSLFDKINEGHPCPEVTSGVCHDGWCTKRDSHFGLVTIAELTFHLAHSVNNTVAHICVTNSSHPVSFPLDPIKLGTLCVTYLHEFDHVVSPSHHYNLYNWTVQHALPDSSLVHVQIFDQSYYPKPLPKSAHAAVETYYDGVTSKPIARPPGHPLPSVIHHTPKPVIPPVFLGGATFSVHQIALDHQAKHDGVKVVNLKLGNNGGTVNIHATWKGVVP